MILYKTKYFFFLLALFLCTCAPTQINASGSGSYSELSYADKQWVDQTLNSLSLYEKCAQLIMPYAYSIDTSRTSEQYLRLVKLVKQYKVGGLLFLQGEIFNQASITNHLQKLSNIPLLIAADYERGLGMRLSGTVEYPYNMALGAANDPELTYLMAKYTAIESRAIGVHQNFAPLIDVNHDFKNPIINIRSYSEDPNIISWHTRYYLDGLHSGNMLSTAKHFPGHGATDVDSHNEIPVIKLSPEELEAFDLIPFKTAIENNVKAVMIGHLEVPAFDSEKGMPATFSKNIITKFLKEKLNFNGLIYTDAMNMHAITSNYSVEEASVKAIEAGNDIVLFPYDDPSAIRGLFFAVLEGKISEERINHSVKKVLAAKKWLKLDKAKIFSESAINKFVKEKSHKRLASEIATKSITLVNNKTNLIPLDNSNLKNVTCISIGNSSRKSKLKDPLDFENAVKNNFKITKTFRLNLSSKKRDYRRALNLAKKSKLILLPLYITVRSFKGNVGLDKNQLKFIKDLIALKKPLVIMSFGNPYILGEFPKANTYLCAYGGVQSSQVAMLNAILGFENISGRLPISIPNTDFKIGYGVNLQKQNLHFQEISSDSNYSYSEINSLMNKALEDSVFPGANILVGHKGKVIFNKSYGRLTYDDKSDTVSNSTIFDLASLSKVVSTTTAAMLLYDKGLIHLNDNVIEYLPEFDNNLKDQITIRHLLTHSSGLPSFKPYYLTETDSAGIIDDIMNSELKFVPGEKYLYSDLGIITLQQIIERVTQTRLDSFVTKEFFEPLGMSSTFYNPTSKNIKLCAPTENDTYWRNKLIHGEVHDEAASILGGIAGHAGLFSITEDLAKFCYMLLNKGSDGKTKILNGTTINSWTTKQSSKSSRGLGWDTKSKRSSAGSLFSSNSFGHTGFTGTSIWIDKSRDLFVILLTNRVFPSRDNKKIIKFRPTIHDAIIRAVDYN